MNIKITAIERWTPTGGAMWMTRDAWQVVVDALASNRAEGADRIEELVRRALVTETA